MSGVGRVLHGRRVVLRPYSAGFSDPEIEQFRAWSGDDEVVGLAGGTPVNLPPDRFRYMFLSRLHERNSDREQQFAILDEEGVLIGRTGLFALDRRIGDAELGIMIGDRERWGRNYGRDAVRTLAAHAFTELGVARIRLYTFPHNVRAQRAFRSVGFRVTRKLRRFSLERGLHVEIEMMLTADRLRSANATLVDDGKEDRAHRGRDAVASDGWPVPDEPHIGL